MSDELLKRAESSILDHKAFSLPYFAKKFFGTPVAATLSVQGYGWETGQTDIVLYHEEGAGGEFDYSSVMPVSQVRTLLRDPQRLTPAEGDLGIRIGDLKISASGQILVGCLRRSERKGLELLVRYPGPDAWLAEKRKAVRAFTVLPFTPALRANIRCRDNDAYFGAVNMLEGGLPHD